MTSRQAERFTQQLLELMRRLHGRMKERMRKYPINLSQIHALVYIEEQNRVCLHDLATRLHMRAPSVTTLIQDLVRLGYVRRVAHPSDKRSTMIQLTAKGKTLMRDRMKHLTQSVQDLVAGLSSAQQAQFTNLLNHILDSSV